MVRAHPLEKFIHTDLIFMIHLSQRVQIAAEQSSNTTKQLVMASASNVEQSSKKTQS